MQSLKITSRRHGETLQVESLFKPGGTLERVRYCGGKYSNPLGGRHLDMPDHVKAIWTEKRKDKEGPYWALFAMISRSERGF